MPRSFSASRSYFALAAAMALVFGACSSHPEPNANQPASSQPAASQPAASQPAASQPAASQPAASQPPAGQPASGKPATNNKIAVIETTAGTIKVELLANEAPKTVENFKQLAQRGMYNGTIFHRVISGFMIQGGDPTGNGTGGQTADGKPLPNEVNRASTLYQGGYKRGLVAMANKGTPETGTSQFFIMHQNYPLPPNYTVFGRVVEGMNVVDQIASAPTSGPNNRPNSPVKMNKVSVQ